MGRFPWLLTIIKKRINKNPILKEAYLKEKSNYHIACKIREYRKAAGLTQKRLAEFIGTKQSVISRIENAEYKGHSLSVLAKIAAVLNIKIEDLVGVKTENHQILSLHIPPIMRKAASFYPLSSNQIERNLMLDKYWLSTCAPLGVFDSTTQVWKALGAGVFVYDDPFIWYITAYHLIKDKGNLPIHVLVNHAKANRYLVDIDSLHNQHKIDWLIDNKNDLAATLFPVDPSFVIKAISSSSFMSSKEMIPSMKCYSVGCPYSLAGFDMEKVNPCVLDGIVSGIDTKQLRVYVTVPTFPGNSGGPLFVWKDPIQPNGVNLGSSVLYLGGIISEYILVGNGTTEKTSQMDLPPLHLGVVISSEAILDLLQNANAIDLKNRIKKTS